MLKRSEMIIIHKGPVRTACITNNNEKAMSNAKKKKENQSRAISRITFDIEERNKKKKKGKY